MQRAHKLNNMLRIFRDNKESFWFLIEAAIRSWEDKELEFLAESLVHFFLCDPDSDTPTDSLLERLEDIIDIDIRLLKEKGNIEEINNNSFSGKIFEQIVKLPESRHYIQKTLNKFYDEIDISELSEVLNQLNDYQISANLKESSNDQSKQLESIEEEVLEYEDKVSDPHSNPHKEERQNELFGQLLSESFNSSNEDYSTRGTIKKLGDKPKVLDFFNEVRNSMELSPASSSMANLNESESYFQSIKDDKHLVKSPSVL